MKFMRKVLLTVFLIAISAAPVLACINVELRVGLVDSLEGHLIADIVSILILERSGVKADVSYFKDSQELDRAVFDKKIDIMVENTTNAMALLNNPLDDDPAKNILTTKILYQRDKGLIWLEPFGYSHDKEANAALVTKEILDKFPGMPRVLGKLSGSLDDPTWTRLVGLVKKGNKSAKVAKDFLVSKKFI